VLAPFAVAVALASPVQFLQAHQLPTGGFAETGGPPSAALTAWASIAVVAAGAEPGAALDYLEEHDGDPMPPATRALVALAEAMLGDGRLAASLPTQVSQTNTVIWTVLATRQARRPVSKALVQTLLDRQSPTGGWSWARGVAPDSNDTAVALQALRSAGVTGAPIRRGLGYLRGLRNRDGGFALVGGRESDAQSTAWAIQAFLATGLKPPAGAYAYLSRLRRTDGSYRYSKRYSVTPVWVTAQVLLAVEKRPFPVRGLHEGS
jgi:hypothetical protein